MDLGAVMQEIADRLDTIDGLRVHASPPGAISAPAAVVSYPNNVTFDETYGRGMDRMELPVVLAVGRPTDRGTRDSLAAYCAGSGSASIKAVLESGTYTEFDVIRVASVDFDVITLAAIDYMAAVFVLDIAGTGS